jgi:hypothetical protein
MPPTTPATDSANELRPILGDDATATFENDPNFVNSNPAENGSSENVEEQRSAAASYAAATRKATDDDEDEEEDEDEEDDLDDDDEDDDSEDDDEEDIDDEDEDEDDFDDDDEDEDEDDEDEVHASSVLHADGLLGYEDEADDVRNGVDRKTGDRQRVEAEEELNDGEKSFDPYSSEDGKWLPVERDDVPEQQGALIRDKNAEPDFVPPYRGAALEIFASL